MKILIIRFSSFGDVLQTLSVVGRLHEDFPQAEIHWVTRREFEPLLVSHPALTKVWFLEKGSNIQNLLSLGRTLTQQRFTHVYDAHNNLRSHVLGWQLQGFLGWRVWTGRLQFLRRSIYRWRRFLLFRFRWNLFPQPFSGQFALLEPLKEWDLTTKAPPPPQLFLPTQQIANIESLLAKNRSSNSTQESSVTTIFPTDQNSTSQIPMSTTASAADFVALAPSAAFPLKRWPLEHWAELIRLNPQTQFVILGGPEDHFLADLASIAPDRVTNLAGQLSLLESACVIAKSKALVANDTGLMHVAEQLGKPCLALMGPAPFGFPSRPLTEIFELQLACRPCSKHGQGPCVNPEFHKCLRDIRPQTVTRSLQRILHVSVASPLPRS